MVTLKRIEIEGFKSIRKLDLELQPLNILIGANGAGKSNLMSVFKLLNQIVERNIQLFVGKSGGANNLLHFGRKVTDEMKFRLSFEDGVYGYEISLVPSTKDTLIFAQERWNAYPRHVNVSVEKPLKGDLEESSFFDTGWKPASSTPQEHLQYILKNLIVYHFQDTSESARMKTTGYIGDNESLKSDAANLAAFLYLLRERHTFHYHQIVATVQLIAPFFDDFILRPDPHNPDNIRLEWREKGSDLVFNANMLSDGTLRFICLAAVFLQPQPPPIILIDEPELGLHPYALVLFAGMVQSAATKTQIIISTQSVTLMNQFAAEEIIVVEKHGSESTFRRLQEPDIAEWLEDYSLGELWEKNVIGGRPG
jgi:predicted ATPase